MPPPQLRHIFRSILISRNSVVVHARAESEKMHVLVRVILILCGARAALVNGSALPRAGTILFGLSQNGSCNSDESKSNHKAG